MKIDIAVEPWPKKGHEKDIDSSRRSALNQTIDAYSYDTRLGVCVIPSTSFAAFAPSIVIVLARVPLITRRLNRDIREDACGVAHHTSHEGLASSAFHEEAARQRREVSDYPLDRGCQL